MKTTRSLISASFATLIALALVPATLAQSTLDGPDGNPVLSAQLQAVPQNTSTRCQQLIPTAAVDQTLGFSSDDGAIDVFNPGSERDVMVTFTNQGADTIEVEVTNTVDSVPSFETVAAGRSLSREFVRVSDMRVTCLSDGTRPGNCSLKLSILSASPSGDGPGNFDLDLWYNGPAVAGDADVEPDSWGDCLWEKDTLWSSANGRDIQVNVQLTGDHDAEVEIEYSNHTFATYDLSAPPALPQFSFLQEFFDDVIAVRVLGSKSPVNACSNLKYHYSVTVLP